ncbi:uncharacterized protein B0T23DRAFT_384305 [Neurospora hispaniola]|uniref:Uncharacterized protein n=1 Tax=Neurospora hispaniola TaxID=588809 RepID=A0AAJ0I3C0_9PEZI|nr:hypothetical protein B0T23DRAFT_384305 [Neurospora hispaniola]
MKSFGLFVCLYLLSVSGSLHNNDLGERVTIKYEIVDTYLCSFVVTIGKDSNGYRDITATHRSMQASTPSRKDPLLPPFIQITLVSPCSMKIFTSQSASQ